MSESSKNLSRATFVRGAVVLPALAGLLAGVSAPARASKGSKAQFKYQETPHGSQKCANCSFFIAGKTATADGQCKLVDGSISPNAWCIAYSAKS